MALVDDEYWVEMVRFRAGPAEVERRIKETARLDGAGVEVRFEQEPGSSGKLVRRHIAGRVLPGLTVRFMNPSGSKYERAKPFASSVGNGLVRWADEDTGRSEAMAEMRAFTDDPRQYAHDDIVDACSMAHEALTRPAFRLSAEVV